MFTCLDIVLTVHSWDRRLNITVICLSVLICYLLCAERRGRGECGEVSICIRMPMSAAIFHDIIIIMMMCLTWMDNCMLSIFAELVAAECAVPGRGMAPGLGPCLTKSACCSK